MLVHNYPAVFDLEVQHTAVEFTYVAGIVLCVAVVVICGSVMHIIERYDIIVAVGIVYQRLRLIHDLGVAVDKGHAVQHLRRGLVADVEERQLEALLNLHIGIVLFLGMVAETEHGVFVYRHEHRGEAGDLHLAEYLGSCRGAEVYDEQRIGLLIGDDVRGIAHITHRLDALVFRKIRDAADDIQIAVEHEEIVGISAVGIACRSYAEVAVGFIKGILTVHLTVDLAESGEAQPVGKIYLQDIGGDGSVFVIERAFAAVEYAEEAALRSVAVIPLGGVGVQIIEVAVDIGSSAENSPALGLRGEIDRIIGADDHKAAVDGSGDGADAVGADLFRLGGISAYRQIILVKGIVRADGVEGIADHARGDIIAALGHRIEESYVRDIGDIVHLSVHIARIGVDPVAERDQPVVPEIYLRHAHTVGVIVVVYPLVGFVASCGVGTVVDVYLCDLARGVPLCGEYGDLVAVLIDAVDIPAVGLDDVGFIHALDLLVGLAVRG